MRLSENEIEAARALVESLAPGTAVVVDGGKRGVIARHVVRSHGPAAHIYVRFEGNSRATLVHGARLEVAR